MFKDYFHQVARATPTRLWINNPTIEEADLAIATGAVSCTTNPTYSASILAREAQRAFAALDQAIRETRSDAEAADRTQQLLIQPLLEKWRPLFESGTAGMPAGAAGFVSIQGDPARDDDADNIIEEALRYRSLGPNFIAKIPVTEAGLKAIEAVVAEGIPVIATEVFAMAQATAVCELYGRVTRKTGRKPAIYVTHISGIYDEYLEGAARKAGVEIKPEILSQAGCALAKEIYRVFREEGYDGIMLGGGARAIRHFTDLVGGGMHVTINWSMAAEMLSQDLSVEPRILRQAPAEVIEELLEKLPDFRKAWEPQGLELEAFAEYGPVLHFRDIFIKGWDTLTHAVAARRPEAGRVS